LSCQGDQNVETFDIELIKGTKGLGITIAGYVGENSSGRRTIINMKEI